ncbi:DUF917 family protein [Nonomuraea dietziae]
MARSPLIKAGDLAEDALVVPIAATGSITCLIEWLPTGAEFAAAITAVGRHRGEPVAAAHGFQTGGANALIAVAAAAWSGTSSACRTPVPGSRSPPTRSFRADTSTSYAFLPPPRGNCPPPAPRSGCACWRTPPSLKVAAHDRDHRT